MARKWRIRVAMDKIPAITVRVGEDGTLIDVDVEGQARPTELVETKPSEPMPSFGDEEYKERVRPWLAG